MGMLKGKRESQVPPSWLSTVFYCFKGAREVTWVQIMQNGFKCLVVRWGDGGHFAEKFVPSQSYHSYRVAIRLSLLGNG